MGVPQDYNKAFYWYSMAAKQEDAESLYILAVMYAKGQGIQKDYVTAYKLAARAAKANKSAIPFLKNLRTMMTPDQIAEAAVELT